MITAVSLISCTQNDTEKMFHSLEASETGLHFSNELHETDTTHSFINEFGYMGGGIGIGDFNNDGLKDIFFSGNQVSSRLYLNKGNYKFEDITIPAGLSTASWATGVSIVDINQDGYDDIYVCVFGKNLVERAPNLLFINQQNLSFKEEAAAWGLADTGYSTQAIFLDYDRDGDLDMYLTNYLLNGPNANTIFPRDRTGRSAANDRLFRNEGKGVQGTGKFTDVTMEAGIKDDGYGLGVVVSDLNMDGWPDIYVANDFVSNDLLWLNNRDGTFTNRIADAIQHQSYSSMGADAADINNDGFVDIATLDMLPETNERRKTSFSMMNYERYQAERSMGYEPSFMRNMLQLNNGPLLHDSMDVPLFSEIGQLAGIQATDWSWSVLAADFNNDGWKDLHVTNGIGRDFINADFLEFSNSLFTGSKTQPERESMIRSKLADLDHVKLNNYLFINDSNYHFNKVPDVSQNDQPSMSNGAAYADLDNDGDLDLVVNNINAPALLLINNTNKPGKASVTHFLRCKIKGDSLNLKGFGSKITVHAGGKLLVQEQNPVRGYFSSVDQDLLFGLGAAKQVDSVVIVWPDLKRMVLTGINTDTTITLDWRRATASPSATNKLISEEASQKLFTDITANSGVNYRHHDNVYNDFASQRLLPQKYSQLGPFITTGDIDNDGATDFFVGGGFKSPGVLVRQLNTGIRKTPGAAFFKLPAFSSRKISDSIKTEEDEDCLFFDADGDGDQDLLITSGDLLYEEGSDHYRPRLYLNNGKGDFSLSVGTIPGTVATIAGAVTSSDYDGDGDIDLFIGGRVSKNYPIAPRSFVLRNDKGRFSDVTSTVCPALQQAGMITAAIWANLDGDKFPDLVIAGDWMPVRLFGNDGKGKLHEQTSSSLPAGNNGMWRSLESADLDGDGDLDLVAGNLGLNCMYNVSNSRPMQLYATDMDNNGTQDPILFYYIPGLDSNHQSYPAISRGQFAEQVPAIRKKFLHYSDYARAGANDIFDKKMQEKMLLLRCEETRSCWFENKGNGRFEKHPLPVEAQFAPVNAIICEDLDNDGVTDLLLAGNEFQSDVITGRYDASYGVFLKGNHTGNFAAIPAVRSGLVLRGDVKDLAFVTTPSGEKLVIAAVNNDSLRVFRLAGKPR